MCIKTSTLVRGVRLAPERSPVGTAESASVVGQNFQPSLRDYALVRACFPALKRGAIFNCPYGAKE